MQMQDAQAVISIMQGQYEQILAIEAPWGIRFREGDMRPRIEYFHDAVRALTSGSDDPYSKHSRLSVEYLAHDIGHLRHIQARPIGNVNRNLGASPHQEVIKAGDHAAASSTPDRATRTQLGQLYKDYTVLFVALFAQTAEDNFQVRSDEVDHTVEDIALIEDVLNKLVNGDISVQQAEAMLDQIEQDQLRDKLMMMLRSKKIGIAEKDQMVDQLGMVESQLENEKRQVEQAHMAYATGQLAIYEDAKETIKRLSAQGLNLAGKFVETAMSKGQGQSRGR